MLSSIIRTHCQNTNRLSLLERTIKSCIDKCLTDMTIADDNSPLKEQVKDLAAKYNIKYILGEYKPSTNQGLCNSLKVYRNEPYTLQLTDDAVLGKDFKQLLNKLINYDLAGLGTWGIITAFCPSSVSMHLRKGSLFNNTKLYKLDTNSPLIHAMICCIMSKEFANAYIEHWEAVRGTDKEQDIYMDDIRARLLCKEKQLGMYMTKRCWSNHTGNKEGDRSFDDVRQGKNYYVAADFIGE